MVNFDKGVFAYHYSLSARLYGVMILKNDAVLLQLYMTIYCPMIPQEFLGLIETILVDIFLLVVTLHLVSLQYVKLY